MIPDHLPFLRHLPPRTLRALQQAINVCSRQAGLPPDWVQRWVAFTIVADALTQTRGDGVSAFELKGGAAIELRLRSPDSPYSPRASKDLDATFRGAFADIDAAVRSALTGEHQGFTFRVQEDGELPRHMRRYVVSVSYLGASFSRVKLEVSAYEGVLRTAEAVPAPSLRGFGLDGPAVLPCLPLTKQIAQKLHAVTELPADGRRNDRFRDLIDLVLLSSLVPASVTLREVCEETFSVREQHRWPPSVVAHSHWIEPLERMAAEIGLSMLDAQAIVIHVANYVRAIAAA
jgi:hypothetical protein